MNPSEGSDHDRHFQSELRGSEHRLRRSLRPGGLLGKALGRPVSPGAVAGDMAVDATDPASGPRLILHPVPEPKTAKNRLRLIQLPYHHDEETERLTGLGAKPLNETKLPAVRQTTFADPEG